MSIFRIACALALLCLALPTLATAKMAPGDCPVSSAMRPSSYSPLTEINDQNIERLNLLWYFDIPGTVLATSSPVAADGIDYFTTSYSVVHAVDGSTGRLLWTYVPKSSRSPARTCELPGAAAASPVPAMANVAPLLQHPRRPPDRARCCHQQAVMVRVLSRLIGHSRWH